MKSVMSHSFSRTPQISIPRSTFDRSCAHKTTFDGGDLIPIFVDFAVPGDTFNVKTAGFARMATPQYPIMDNLYLDTFFFSVPMRLLWDNFRKFMGEQEDPGDSIDYTVPEFTGVVNSGSILDHMGFPVIAGSYTASALPLRAYWKIFNEWFRDQNLIDSKNCPTDNGPDTLGSDIFTTPAKRGKRHDYFTSCLPWPQKFTSPDLPLGTKAPVHALTNAVDQSVWVHDDNSGNDYFLDHAAGLVFVDSTAGSPGTYGELYANLASATAATINELREAFQIQRLLERDARAGTRYSEIVKSHFGVTFVDATYRPEYLGGGSTPININPVASSNGDATGNLGDLAAFATAAFRGHGFVKSFTEHSVVIGLCNVRADLTYQEGLDRQFSYSTRYDFYWPSLAQIGEQAVTNGEIYFQGTSADDNVFGYQERYGEMRYKKSLVTGLFRSAATGSLDVWHLSDEFGSLPSLNEAFINDSAETVVDRACGTPSEPQFIADFWFDFKAARPMPLFGTPGNLDRL